MTTAQMYHGHHGTIVMKDDTETDTYIDNTSSALGVKDWQVVLNQTLSEARGQDSILWQDVVRTNIDVSISIRYLKFTGAELADIMGTVTADKDVDGNVDAGRSRGSINDTAELNKYTFWGYLTHGSDTFIVKVEDVAWENVPLIIAPTDDWVEVNLTGKGKTAYIEFDS